MIGAGMCSSTLKNIKESIKNNKLSQYNKNEIINKIKEMKCNVNNQYLKNELSKLLELEELEGLNFENWNKSSNNNLKELERLNVEKKTNNNLKELEKELEGWSLEKNIESINNNDIKNQLKNINEKIIKLRKISNNTFKNTFNFDILDKIYILENNFFDCVQKIILNINIKNDELNKIDEDCNKLINNLKNKQVGAGACSGVNRGNNCNNEVKNNDLFINEKIEKLETLKSYIEKYLKDKNDDLNKEFINYFSQIKNKNNVINIIINALTRFFEDFSVVKLNILIEKTGKTENKKLNTLSLNEKNYLKKFLMKRTHIIGLINSTLRLYYLKKK